MRRNGLDLVSIVIVNFNGSAYIERCIDSVLKTDYPRFEVIIVDVASTDGSWQILKEKYGGMHDKVQLLRINEDVGYSPANNVGLEHANGHMVALLNNDVEVSASWLSSLVHALVSNASIGAVQGKQRMLSDRDRIDSVGNVIDRCCYIRQVGYGEVDRGQYDRPLEICVGQPTPMLLKMSTIKNIGGLFDSDYWHLHEDTDLSWRIWMSGKKVLLVPQSVVFHARSASLKTQQQDLLCFHNKKNAIMTMLKNYELRNLAVYLPLHLLILVGLLMLYIRRRRFDMVRASCAAVCWNMRNLRKTFTKRRVVQERIRSRPDSVFKSLMEPLNILWLYRRRSIWP